MTTNTDRREIDTRVLLAGAFAFVDGWVSVSMVQRRLGLGYTDASRVIDRMRELGLVSQRDKSVHYNVIVSRDDWIARVNAAQPLDDESSPPAEGGGR